MSTTPVFNETSSGSGIYVLSTLADTGLEHYWAGYYTRNGSSLGSSASTTAVWQDTGGFYLFLDHTPSDWTIFKDSLNSLLSNFDPQHTARCVWIRNSSADSRLWIISALHAQYAGSGATITWTQLRAWSTQAGMYSVVLNGMAALGYISDANGGGISFGGGGSFNAPGGGYLFTAAALSFSGSGLGAISSSITIAAGTDLGEILNIGLQYAAAPNAFSDDSDTETEEEEESDIASLNATQLLFMPVFTTTESAIQLGLLFDPLNLFVATRTAFSFFPPGGGAVPSMNSYLRTTRGYQVHFTPQAASGKIPDAGFVFGYSPVYGSSNDDVSVYHLSPQGAFRMSIQNPETDNEASSIGNQLLMGLSGLEYITLKGTTYDAVFQGYQKAFIPYIDPDGTEAPDISQALTGIATTSYLNVLAAQSETNNPVYYAQPREAPIFSGQGNRSDGLLNFNPMPAFVLTSDPEAEMPPVFPAGIYAGLSSEQAELARNMENASLAPARNYYIGESYGAQLTTTSLATAPKRRLRAESDPLGVTPQGLIAELTPDYSDFDGLVIGNMPGTEYPTVDLTAVTGLFKQTLQNNQLFFVASNVDVLMSGTSVRYQLTESEKEQATLQALGVPESVITAVYSAVGSPGRVFETESAFVTCIQSAAGSYLADFLYVGGILKVEMDGWTFQLSPRSWRTDSKSPTMMIAKFCNRSLLDLANDTSSWSWPQAATFPGSWKSPVNPDPGYTWTYPGDTDPEPSVKQTQTILLGLINGASAADASAAQQIFYETVVTDPNWNGFLFLNAPVDIGEFPDDLKFLTAGIDLTNFYAHHIGFSQTPFTVSNGAPQLQQTAAFGLIDYNDEADLYADESIPFGFKTMKLHARFTNAALAEFSAEVELMVNQLLGSLLTKQEASRGNNLILEGSYQKVGGAPSYSFALSGQNLFNANYSALNSIEVLSVQLVNGGNAESINVLTTFILSGNLRFALYPDFDMFCFGPGEGDEDHYLRYTGLSIDMSFSLATPTEQTFDVHEGNTSFDLTHSDARPSSLVKKFPLTVTSLIASPNLTKDENEKPTGQTPEDMGFTSVSAPVDQSPMVPSWYGLLYTLDLGTFGALTGSISFKIGILAAWSKGASEDSFNVYIGLRLPGISAIAGSFPLQGVLKLGFRTFQFETYYDESNKLGYLLRMRRFALSFLFWSFPPGNADIVLFGDPDNPSGSLGWYAAYDSGEGSSSSQQSLSESETRANSPKTKKQLKQESAAQRRMRSGRRRPRIG